MTAALIRFAVFLAVAQATQGPARGAPAVQAASPAGAKQAVSVIWEASLEAAMQRASRIGRPVLVAVLAPSEEASRVFLDEVYPSLLVRPLLHEVVCVAASTEATAPLTEGPRKGMSAVFKTMTSNEAQAVARAVEQRYLGDQIKKVPTHILLDGAGHLIANKAGKLEQKEFRRFITTALDAQDPSWRPSTDLADVAKGGDGGGEAIPFAGLFGTDEKAARKAVDALLAAPDKTVVARLFPQIPSGKTRARLFEAARDLSGERDWLAEVLELGVADKDPDVRAQAAVTAEVVRAPGLAKQLLTAFSSEKDEDVRCDLLRAAAASAKGDQAVFDAIEEAVREKSDKARANAYVALARFGDSDDKLASRSVDVLLKRGIKDREDRSRNAAVWALAELRSTRARKEIEKIGKRERGVVKRFYEMALDRIDGKDVSGWQDSRRLVASEKVRR